MNELTPYHARTTHEIEEMVVLLRLHFYNRGECCGAKVIKHHMKELKVNPLPSVTTNWKNTDTSWSYSRSYWNLPGGFYR